MSLSIPLQSITFPPVAEAIAFALPIALDRLSLAFEQPDRDKIQRSKLIEKDQFLIALIFLRFTLGRFMFKQRIF
jgi:hypothetical protein